MAYPFSRAVKGLGLQALDYWIAGSNPAQDMNVLVSFVICSVRSGPLRRADHSCRGLLPGLCVSYCVRCRNLKVRWARPDLGCSDKAKWSLMRAV